MRRLAALAACLLLAGAGLPARAAWLFGASGPSLEAPRQAFAAKRFDQVVAQLADGAIPRMRGSEQSQAYQLLGEAYQQLGRLDKALSVYQLGVRLFPRDLNLLTDLALLLHSSGLEEQAEPLFQKVVSIHPNNAAAHLGLAEIDYRLGFLDRSAEHYEKALETMSDDPRVWRDYSEVLIALRDFKTAELAARKSLSLREEADSRVDLARAQRAAGRLREALDTLELACARYPERADLALTKALWLLEAERYDDALAAVSPQLEGPAPEPLAYWIRARVSLKRDRYGSAVEDLRRAAGAERKAPFVAAAAKKLLKELGAE